ncbi:hypothetical protein FVF58_24185 [Paraburkholderia panacisoli]|uniref:Uncharacterized protein n=1 Tax=Paraburkholderia panacisoli TaxID=2603818 RepID=A0A5B0GYA9_9BURK|nr:hypothetical protein [Paraburkholderia panacisoli]KAA1007802.1 hypothetical protein FVF58_24185 [Paraburkholderia panacisoli]
MIINTRFCVSRTAVLCRRSLEASQAPPCYLSPRATGRRRQFQGKICLPRDYGSVARWQYDALCASLALLQKLEEIGSRKARRSAHNDTASPQDAR